MGLIFGFMGLCTLLVLYLVWKLLNGMDSELEWKDEDFLLKLTIKAAKYFPVLLVLSLL